MRRRAYPPATMPTSTEALSSAADRNRLKGLLRTATDAARRADTMKQQVKAAKAALKDMRKAAKAARKAARQAVEQVAAARRQIRTRRKKAAAAGSAPRKASPRAKVGAKVSAKDKVAAPRKSAVAAPAAPSTSKAVPKRVSRLHPAARVARSVIRRMNAAMRPALPATASPPAEAVSVPSAPPPASDSAA